MTEASKIIIIEGPKNVGKSYLMENSGIPSYKFPFAGYFNAFLKGNTDNVGTGDKATYHFTTSFDVSVMSLAKQGFIKGPRLLIDRGFLSNLVLGVVQKRITDEDAYAYMDFLYKEGYIDSNVKIVYVKRGSMPGGRELPKDQWEYLTYDDVHNKYMQYIDYLQKEYNFPVEIFENNFDGESVVKFAETCLK